MMSRFLQVLTVIIALISIISISYNPKDVWSRIRYYLFTTDDPIFRNLANSTTILIEDLVRLNVPASNKVMKLRTTSDFLADIVSANPTPTDLSPELYLQSIGNKAYIAGTQIEKIYNAGSFALDELFSELQDIRQNLPQPFQDSLLSQKDVKYFHARLTQVLSLTTKFRDKFVDAEKTIREIQKLYLGYNNIRGFSDVIKYFNENESTHKQIYDMEVIKRELDFEQEQIVQLIAVDSEVMRVRQSLDSYRKNLISSIEKIMYLSDKKIVMQEDGQMLGEVIERVNMAKEVWDSMDEDNSRVLRIES